MAIIACAKPACNHMTCSIHVCTYSDVEKTDTSGSAGVWYYKRNICGSRRYSFFMRIDTAKLKSFLLDAGIVKPAALKKAEQESEKTGVSLRDALLNAGQVKEEDVRRLEAYIIGIPFVDLAHESIPHEVLEMIPEPIARTHNIIAYRRTGKNLEVAMLDPDDLQTIEFIRKKEELRILPRLTTA